MARMVIGKEPTEFGGLPGLYADNDAVEVLKATRSVGIPYDGEQELEPHKARMALTRTNAAYIDSEPEYGDGGVKVQ